MTIFGIGVDTFEIYRITDSNVFKLAKRILTLTELKEFEKIKNKNLFVAKKFSIKEAIAKAFGVGIGSKLSFQDIEITHSTNGKPLCTVNPNIIQSIVGQSVIVHISISDTKSLVCTYATIEIT